MKYGIIFLNLLWVFSATAEPIVKISQGRLEGVIQTARYGKRYSAFLGIPYAKPPVEDRR